MNPEETKPDITRGRAYMAAAIMVGHMMKHLYNSGFSKLILPEIKVVLNLSYSQFGWLGSAQALSWWLATMLGGYLGDRFTGRTAMFLGLTMVFIGFSQLVVGFVSNYWILLAAMLLIGGAPAMFHPFAIGELSRRFPDRRGFAVSLHGMGGMTGEVIGPLVVAAVLGFLMWRDMLKLSFFPAILIGFTLWIVLRSLPRMKSQAASRREYFVSMGALLRNPMLMLLVASTAIRGVGESAVEGFLPVYLKETLEFSDRNIALVFSGAQVIGLISQPVMGFLSDRVGRKDRPRDRHRQPRSPVAAAQRCGSRRPGGAHCPGEGRVQVLAAPHLHRGGHRHVEGRGAVDRHVVHVRRGPAGDILADRRGRDIGRIRYPRRLRLRRSPDAPGAGRAGPLPRSDSRLAGGGVRDR